MVNIFSVPTYRFNCVYIWDDGSMSTEMTWTGSSWNGAMDWFVKNGYRSARTLGKTLAYVAVRVAADPTGG